MKVIDSPDKHLGPVELDARGAQSSSTAAGHAEGPDALQPLPTLQNLDDFESAAKKVVSRKAWVYFKYGADSLTSCETNRTDWSKVSLRPRILRNVAKVSMRRTVMSHASAFPFFIAPFARARLGHDDGELCLARGAARHNIPYCSSTYSSVSHTDLAHCLESEGQGGALLFQLYVPIVKRNATKLIAEARRFHYKALVIMVDSAVIGKREEDDRYKAELDYAAGIEIPRTESVDGEAPILRGAHTSTLDWDDLSWIREVWDNAGPVILKGIQTAENALKAAQVGVDGINLSNHGGRQMDHAPSSLRTLLEIRKFYPDVLNRVEVYLDGGITRGTDVIKALCLGAEAVGLGRPFLYALSAYGTEGVGKAIQCESLYTGKILPSDKELTKR